MDVLLALVVLVPLAAAAFVRVPGVAGSRRLVVTVSGCAALGTAVLASIACAHGLRRPLVHWVGGWEPRDGAAIGIALVGDGLATGFVALAAMLTTAALVFAARRYERLTSPLHALTLVFLAAFNGFVLAGDVLTMFVFLELMGISSYLLTAFHVDEEAPLPAAFNVGVVSTIGAALFLLGATIIYAAAGTPNLAEAGERLGLLPIDPAIALGVALLLVGLAIKAAIWPFHFAHADAHAVAPSPHAGLFGAVLIQAGLYGIVRLHATVLGAAAIEISALRGLLLSAAVATALVAAVSCVLQTQLKRILAFSSVAHLGIAAIGVGLLSARGLAGAALYVAGHAMVKVAMFLAASVLLGRTAGLRLEALGPGRKEVWPLLVVLAVGALALAGAPPSGLFGGKALIGEAAGAAGLAWIGLVLYAAAALTGVALLRAAIRLTWSRGDPGAASSRAGGAGEHAPAPPGRPPFVMIAVPALLLGIGLVLPLWPGAIAAFEEAAAQAFDRRSYAGAVLAHAGGPADERAAGDVWTGDALVKGAITVAVTSALAVAGAWRARRGGRAAGLLQRLHRGHVGDYVVWLTVGLALASAWILWSL